MEDKIYLVSHSEQNYEDYEEEFIFATTDKQVAYSYADRYNALLKKWRDYYKQFEVKQGACHSGISHLDIKYYRWITLKNLNGCKVTKVNMR